MIKPHKYLNLDSSVLNQSALILVELRKNNVIKYDELTVAISKKVGTAAIELFPAAISFLYLMGKINYFQEIDSFELNEAK